MQYRSIGRIAALSLVATLAFAACSSGSGSSPSAAAPPWQHRPWQHLPWLRPLPEFAAPSGSAAAANPNLNVVFIPKAISNPYFNAAATGAQKAATGLSAQTMLGDETLARR